MVLSGYGGDALSTIAVAGQDYETTVATVTIEPGTEPLWIFAVAFDPIIWNLIGATERVERFVAQPTYSRSKAGVGVVGLDAERVNFVPERACMPYLSDPNDGKAMIEKAKMANWIPRPIDDLIAHYTLAGVAVPSGRLTKRKNNSFEIVAGGETFVVSPRNQIRSSEGAAKQVEGIGGLVSTLRHYNHGAIVNIALNDVVASQTVERYEVLPQQAGLLQLMLSGALKRTNDGYFLIVKPIPHFPAGLGGGHSVKFILGTGIPMPKGSPGHSPVYDQSNGECLVGRC